MKEKIDAVVEHIQGRCLWQFFSRAWDREENIEGVLEMTSQLLAGQEPAAASDQERCHLADARILSRELASDYPWIGQTSPEDLKAVIQGVKERMREIVIDKSRNEELRVQNY